MEVEQAKSVIQITVPEGMTLERLIELANKKKDYVPVAHHDCGDCGHKHPSDGHCKLYSATCATAVSHGRTATSWIPIT